jgi:ribosomal subunit interface protein
MKLLLNIKNMSLPTSESLLLYAKKRFNKLTKFIPKKAQYSPVLSIEASFNRRKKIFDVKIVYRVNGKSFICQVSLPSIQAAIDTAVDRIQRQVTQLKGKRWLHGI